MCQVRGSCKAQHGGQCVCSVLSPAQVLQWPCEHWTQSTRWVCTQERISQASHMPYSFSYLSHQAEVELSMTFGYSFKPRKRVMGNQWAGKTGTWPS